ncbi:MAG: ornithine carbamoyltransferase [Candidatus Hadarchaeales archaeon]
MKKDLLGIEDLSRKEIEELLRLASKYKKERGRKTSSELRNKTVALIFERPSTRTRVSFEVAIHEMGGNPLFLSSQELQLSRGETVADTARTLSRYVHGIVARVSSHPNLVELAKYSTVPVINALSPLQHPCQTLADLLTMKEYKGKLEGLRVAWVGDGNNVCTSLMLGCATMGSHIRIAVPPGYEPPKDLVKLARERAEKSGGKVEIGHDPKEAVSGAEVVYTDVFVSMGMEEEREKRKKDFKNFQVTSQLLSLADEGVIFMHCLPAHRGEEVTDEVIDGPHSVVFDQAENRLHAQKAVLFKFLSGRVRPSP